MLDNSSTNWTNKFFAAYLIPNDMYNREYEEIEKILIGSNLKIEDIPIEYFKHMVQNTDISLPISFFPENGIQTNLVRDLIRNVALGNQNEKEKAAKELAIRLTKFTTKKSPRGLLTIFMREATINDVKTYSVYIWKLAADDAIQAKTSQGSLSLELIKDAFLSSTSYFKAAKFEDIESRISFWKGFIEDKQVGNRNEVSLYWMEKFLKCRIEINDRQGSRIFFDTFRKVISSMIDSKQKTELMDSVRVIASREHSLTLRKIAEDYIPSSLKNDFLSLIRTDMIDLPFKIDKDFIKKKTKRARIIIDVTDGITDSSMSEIQIIGSDSILRKMVKQDNEGNVVINLTGKLIDHRFNN